MDDFEITRKYAEAMEYGMENSHGILAIYEKRADGRLVQEIYNPLKNDSQAMAIIKRFDLSIARGGQATDSPWWKATSSKYLRRPGIDSDLNRAICECVAKMAK